MTGTVAYILARKFAGSSYAGVELDGKDLKFTTANGDEKSVTLPVGNITDVKVENGNLIFIVDGEEVNAGPLPTGLVVYNTKSELERQPGNVNTLYLVKEEQQLYFYAEDKYVNIGDSGAALQWETLAE